MNASARSWARAAAYAAAIPLVAGAAAFALARFPLAPADALALAALDSASRLALAAAAIGSLSREGLAKCLGLGRGRLPWSAAVLGLLGLLGASHAADAVLVLVGGAQSPGLARFDVALARLSPESLAFSLLALALGSAVGEELFFRGLLQRALEPRLGAAGAIAVAALAFGAAHGDWVHGGAAAVLGLYLGALAQAAGSIRPAIAAHAANNALAVLQASSTTAPRWALAAGLALTAFGVLALASHRSAGEPSAGGAPRPHVSQPIP